MKTIFVDVETYYDDEYSLRRMTPIEYILDPRFECIGWAVSSNGLAGFMSEVEFRTFLGKLTELRAGGEKIAMVSHNATFDMSVLASRFNFIPDLMIDTLGMSRAWYGHKFKSLSLETLASKLELGEKLDTIKNLKGMSLAAIKAAGIWDKLKIYALNDVVICQRIYERIMDEGFPAEELLVVDSVLRCAVSPMFLLDRPLLHEHLAATQAGKSELLARCGLQSRDDLMSNDRFAQALVMLGVEPPRKISLTTGKETYAFAKTDPAFLELEEHEDERVQALVSARLGVKSTIEETRTQRLINIGNLDWSHLGPEPRMPVPLRFSGAHTHRLSGDWKLNMQNLRRGGKLRQALKALPGQVIVVADASQIEARGVAAFAGQEDLVQQFANGEDVYSSFASEVFLKAVNKKDNPVERFIGKTGILGLGYGLGAPKFQSSIKTLSKNQIGTTVELSDVESKNIVTTYRRKYSHIPDCWKFLDYAISEMVYPGCHIERGPVVFEYERVRLPNGLYLNYRHLNGGSHGWEFTYGGMTKHLYGGKLLENIIQALSRIAVMEAGTRIRRQLGRHFIMQVHDELVFMVPEDEGQDFKRYLIAEMSRRPAWWPNIPLAAEGEIGLTYGDAK